MRPLTTTICQLQYADVNLVLCHLQGCGKFAS